MLIEANGIRIHCRVDGRAGDHASGREGAPWVTFVNGIANDLSMWDGQVAALADDFRILRYDARGHGGTQATPGDYTFGTLIGDLLALWDALGVHRSHLAGLGLGGATAIGLAIDHSDRLLSLAPCCCRARMTPEFAAMWPGFVERVKAGGMEAMVEPTVQRWFTQEFRDANPSVIESVRSQIRGTNPLGYYGCIAAFLTLDFRDHLGRIRVPTQFLSGAEDRLGGPPAIMQELAEAVPGARHVSVPGAAHICNIQNPGGFNDALGAFLRAHSG